MTANTANDQQPKPRSKLRRLGLLLGLLLSGASLVLSALWWWAGTPGSLASTLNLAAQLMPASQRLSTDLVEGSLRHGGQVGQWHWQQGALQVRGEQTALTLDWPRLWQGHLPLAQLHLGRLKIDDQNPASEPQALTTLHWPLRVDLPWRIDWLEWAGPPAFEASGLHGHYRYDGSEHHLEVQPFEVAQGRYSAQARLQAAAPMALHASLQGQVHTMGPAGSKPLTLTAQATAEGTLSGLSAALEVKAQLQPSSATGSGPSMQLQVQAQIHPWQAQAITQARADWQQLDMAALWPGAPQTRLGGQASVTPEGSGWHIQGQLNNQNPGPWDRHALPLSHLSAQLHHPGHGLWQITQLQAKVAGGQVQGAGQQTPAGWTGQVNIAGVQPELLHTAMAAGALNGQIKAQASDARTVSIQADLQGASALGKNATGLRWDKLHLQGQWQAALWKIESLEVQAADAKLQAQFSFAPQQQSAQGQVEWQWPGMKAQAQGVLAPKQGQGHLEVAMNDAALSMAWLKRWPGWAERLQGWQASGPAKLNAQWQGGYRQADAPIQLNMTLPRLNMPAQGPEAWQLQQSHIAVQGSLQALQASIDARWLNGHQTVQLQSTATASSSALLGSPWQGNIQSASVQVSSPERTAPWKAQLQEAVGWQWTPSAIQDLLQWQAGRIAVQGPSTGQAALRWDAGQWQTRSLAPQGAAAARSKQSADRPHRRPALELVAPRVWRRNPERRGPPRSDPVGTNRGLAPECTD
jgi:translocation and assembly module TamB